MYASLAAIRPDGSGDVTENGVIWQSSDGLPDTSSPLATGDFVFLAGSYGPVTCSGANDGETVWSDLTDTPFNASPILVGGRVYMLDCEGVMHVLDAAGKFREQSTAAIGEEAGATPAFVGGRIYIRGEKHLFCVGAK